jgi:putative mRNA 3-end processing factor
VTRRSRESRPPVEWRGGVHISGTPLWCDAHRAREACFVSSALVPSARRHRQIIATRETLELLPELPRARRGVVRALAVPTGRPFTLGDVRLELFPSGTIVGAASLLVDVGQRRIVFAGAVKTRPGQLVGPAEGRACDVLIIDATFAGIRYPAPATVLDELAAWVERVRAAGDTPVILAAPLTAAPEVLSRLGAVGPLRAHRAVAAVVRRLGRLGVALPPVHRLAGPPPVGDIVVCPPTHRDAPGVADLPRARFAIVSGLAADPSIPARLRVEAAFPLAEAAGGDDLLDYVAQSGARTVYLVGHTSGSSDVARTLADRGLVVRRLGPPEQLRLPLG